MRVEIGESTVAAIAKRPYWYQADARVIVAAWRRSGVGLDPFASRHGIRVARLARWARRLESAGAAAVATPPRRRSRPMRFVPVGVLGAEAEPERLPPLTLRGTPIAIDLPDGRTVRVAAGFAADDLARVLAVLAGGALVDAE